MKKITISWLWILSLLSVIIITTEYKLLALIMMVSITSNFLCILITSAYLGNKKIYRKDNKIKLSELERISLRKRGWLVYVRNLSESKLDDYIKKLKDEFQDITDDKIKIATNKNGNYVIMYTFNKNLSSKKKWWQ
jgi:hypothetical protein